jgi:hypothetical protein
MIKNGKLKESIAKRATGRFIMKVSENAKAQEFED